MPKKNTKGAPSKRTAPKSGKPNPPKPRYRPLIEPSLKKNVVTNSHAADTGVEDSEGIDDFFEFVKEHGGIDKVLKTAKAYQTRQFKPAHAPHGQPGSIEVYNNIATRGRSTETSAANVGKVQGDLTSLFMQLDTQLHILLALKDRLQNVGQFEGYNVTKQLDGNVTTVVSKVEHLSAKIAQHNTMLENLLAHMDFFIPSINKAGNMPATYFYGNS